MNKIKKNSAKSILAPIKSIMISMLQNYYAGNFSVMIGVRKQD
jgi:hypothetical protein